MRLRRNRDVVLRMQRRFREHIERQYGRHERHEAERQVQEADRRIAQLTCANSSPRVIP